MTADELKHYEALLLKKRGTLMHELGYFGEKTISTNARDIAGSYPYSEHPADQGTESMEQEQAYKLASREGRFLFHIDEALELIKDETYGTCNSCEGDIGPMRLEAVPHARMCIECKSKEEQDSA
ncbi:MAG: TraR/DksA C4-type zinc finger protein [Candidatus Latescibacteria bacterium]|nr:TraR/DksA C4-type zinc finger protein [Candidatus Latescibacterota bacterium]